MKKKIIILITAAFLILTFLFTFYPKASNKPVFTREELNYINENKDTIIFLGYYNSPSEKLFAKKICQKMSKDLTLNIVPYDDSWENTMLLLENSKLPMVSNMNITEERLEYISFTPSFTSISSGVYSDLNSPIDSYKKLKNETIGIVKNVTLLDEFDERYPSIGCQIVYYDDIEELISAFNKNEIDGFVSTKSYDENLKGFYYFKIPSISKDNNHIGVNKQHNQLYNIISKEVEYLIETGWDKKIKSIIDFELERRSMDFSNREKEYINNTDSITVGLIKGFDFYGYGEDHYPKGIITNIFEKIDFISDIDFNFVFDSYDNLLLRDDVDIVISTNNNNRSSSNPIFSNGVSVIGKSNMPIIKEVYDIESYSIGVINSDPVIRHILKIMPFLQIKTYYYNELLDMIDKDEIDYAIIPTQLYENMNKTYKNIECKGEIGDQFHYAIIKNDKDLPILSILNKCIAVINVDEIVYDEIKTFTQKEESNIAYIVFLAFLCILFGLIINFIIKVRKRELRTMYTDNETGINNIKWLEKRMKNSIEKYTFFMVKVKDLYILKERYGEKTHKKAYHKVADTLKQNVNDDEFLAIIEKGKFIIVKKTLNEEIRLAFLNKLENLFGQKLFINNMRYEYSLYAGSLDITDDTYDFKTVIEHLEIAIRSSANLGKGVDFSYDMYSKYHEKIDFDTKLSNAVINEKLEIEFKNIYDSSDDFFAYSASTVCELENFGKLTGVNFEKGIKALDLQIVTDKIVLKKIIKKMECLEQQGNKPSVFVDIYKETIISKDLFLWIDEKMSNLKNSKLFIKLNTEVYEQNIEKLSSIKSNNICFAIKNFGKNLMNDLEIEDFDVEIIVLSLDTYINLDQRDTYEDVFKFIVSFCKKQEKKIMIENVSSKSQYDAIKDIGIDYIGGNYIGGYDEGISC